MQEELIFGDCGVPSLISSVELMQLSVRVACVDAVKRVHEVFRAKS